MKDFPPENPLIYAVWVFILLLGELIKGSQFSTHSPPQGIIAGYDELNWEVKCHLRPFNDPWWIVIIQDCRFCAAPLRNIFALFSQTKQQWKLKWQRKRRRRFIETEGRKSSSDELRVGLPPPLLTPGGNNWLLNIKWHTWRLIIKDSLTATCSDNWSRWCLLADTLIP